MDQTKRDMTINLIEKAQRLIDSHEEAVENVRKSLANPAGNVTRNVRTLVSREMELRYIISHLESQNRCPPELQQGLEQVYKQNELYQNQSPDDFESLLVTELTDLVERYPQIVAYTFELGPLDHELHQDFSQRDSIEKLLEWLPEDVIDQATLERISTVDEVLRHRCELYSEEYREVEEFVARPYYPERYWWRHPEQVLSES